MEKQKYTPHWNRRKYTQEQFIEAWMSSKTIAECGNKLNLVSIGAGYRNLKKTAEYLSLPFDHMMGQSWNKGSVGLKKALPIEHYLCVGTSIGSWYLGKRLIKEGLLEARCSLPYCPNPVKTINGFTGEEVDTPLTLDHINGINDDNRLENLRFICANCDRQNETFGRGSVSKKAQREKEIKEKSLCNCGGTKRPESQRCLSCENDFKRLHAVTRIPWPSDDDLVSMVKSSSYMAAARQLGCSDNAVRKRMKKRGLL